MILILLSNKTKTCPLKSCETFASFPVVGEHVAFGTGTKVGPQSVETRVGTSTVARGALVDVLARVSVTGQLSA